MEVVSGVEVCLSHAEVLHFLKEEQKAQGPRAKAKTAGMHGTGTGTDGAFPLCRLEDTQRQILEKIEEKKYTSNWASKKAQATPKSWTGCQDHLFFMFFS